ncbi:Membrane protein involved in the export of O-antigen and teichoic acid [Salinimicrobium catena]|uniref:Membrane protein involved in the export of O-antigen and teichoic acid n=1 Tax=Salinimicrobium catena TaxID=390640 RepID=A0A1H5M898_9FLAO|nr:polysaccharide biosynthesis C-terminal domain-containing protein [Salinimicrobium catena]SDL20014.1 Membrane protein involved in the export of O-antigen and teichoic acid [Salinimicrobium catena]SEE85596.1 Membrane protein involved in the export of O-antigen and teichoic acid [Salinimicrobium catena]
MGVIINQSAKNLVTTYLGFGIGAINTLFLYTNFLTPEYYGLVGFLLSAANLIWPLMAFGVHNTLVKFYSSYDTKQEQDKLLSVILFLPLGIALILGSIGFFSYDLLLDYFSEGNALVQPYIWMIFVIAVATAYFEIFFSWSKIHFQSVFGNFMKEVFHRACVSLLLVVVYFDVLTVEGFVYSLTGVFILRTIAMKLYAFRLYFPKITFGFPHNRSFILKYSGLILIAGSVAMVLLDLDKVMIERFLPIEMVAVYGIAVYISSVIAVPSRAMHQITYPMTASLLNKKDKKGLLDLYEKSSLTLLIISGLIFLLIVTNIRELYELIPDAYQISFSIVVILSCVKLYDNLLGNNNSILFNSDYYRLVLAIGIFLALLAFVLNLVFIPMYGIFGAALATFLAFAMYNTSKLVIVYKKFGIQPFTKETFYSLFLILVFSLLFYFWDFSINPVVNILLKSVMIGTGYLAVIYLLKFSPDINRLIEKYSRRR